LYNIQRELKALFKRRISVSDCNFRMDSIVRSGDDLDDRFDVLDLVDRLELELPEQLRQNCFLLHQGELLSDAVAGSGRERNVGVRMAGTP
jgi:hypothetical protein